MHNERRRASRKSTDLWVNKFIDGLPHLARVVEVSASGCVLERVLEPDAARDLYPIELALPSSAGGSRMWLWARAVHREGDRTMCKFVGLDPVDRATLTRFIAIAA